MTLLLASIRRRDKLIVAHLDILVCLGSCVGTCGEGQQVSTLKVVKVNQGDCWETRAIVDRLVLRRGMRAGTWRGQG